jgi:F-type H+-transporting ATPase subunit delta
VKQTITGNRYAIALFQLAEEHNQVETIEQNLQVIKAVFHQVKELEPLMKSPKISSEKKKEILREAFSFVSPFVLNTLFVLIDRQRIDHLFPMIEKFHELTNEQKGIAEAKVVSVRPLTDQEKEAISSHFAKKVNKASLKIENIIDSDLLGGLKIQIGNRIFDGSLRGKLDRLKRELVGYQS